MDDTKLDQLLHSLRKRPVHTERLLGFEGRTMAILRQRAEEPAVFFIAWRLAPMFLALLLALGGWMYAISTPPANLHFTALGSGHEEVQMVHYITGD